MAKRPYSTKFTARSNPRRYLLSGIPPTLWARAQQRARQQGIAMRSLILHLLETWLDGDTLESDAARRAAQVEKDG
jgi:hypothetical protein